jgi:hypothetical protein
MISQIIAAEGCFLLRPRPPARSSTEECVTLNIARKEASAAGAAAGAVSAAGPRFRKEESAEAAAAGAVNAAGRQWFKVRQEENAGVAAAVAGSAAVQALKRSERYDLP